MPLIYPAVMDEFRLSYTDIGLLVGVTSLVGGFLQLVHGFLTRYILRKVLLSAGQIIMGLSMALIAFSNTYGLFFLNNLLARVGASPQHPVGIGILSERFSARQRGSALSLHVVGGNIGTLAVPIFGAVLMPLIGWRGTLLVLAAGAVAFALALLFFVEEENNLAQERGKARVSTRSIVRSIFADRTILLVMLAATVAAGGRGLSMIIIYVPLYLEKNLSLSGGALNLLYTLLLVGGVIGPLFGGRLSDTYGRKILLYASYALSATFMLAFIALGGAAPLALGVMLFLLGAASYAESPLLQTFLADVATPLQRDLAFSIFFAVSFGVGAVWPTLLGLTADHWGLPAAFMLMAGSYLVTFLLLLPTREKKPA